MRRFRAGEQEAFTQVYRHIYERMYWLARRYIKEQEEVEDITAEAFLELWRHRQEFQGLASVSAYMYVVVRNQCFALLRRRRVRQERQDELERLLGDPDPNEFYIEQLRTELLQKIFAAVDRLPERMREIFLLSYREGLKPAEIAERMQLKVQTVSNQKINAIRVLKQALGDEFLLAAALALLAAETCHTLI